MDHTCGKCGFSPLAKAERGACAACRGAAGLSAWLGGNRATAWVPPNGTAIAWLPETTQEFVSVLGKTLVALTDLTPGASGDYTRKVASGITEMRVLIRHRIVDARFRDMGPEVGAGPNGDDFVRGLRVVDLAPPSGGSVTWFERGTFADLTCEAIESTGAYLDRA